jgi:thimet oligopeptidase
VLGVAVPPARNGPADGLWAGGQAFATAADKPAMMPSRFLLAGILALVLAGPALGQEPDAAPFTAGITDAASLTRVVEDRLARSRRLLDEMLAVEGPRTIANTLAPYDTLSGELYTAGSQARVMAALHPDKAVRDAAETLNRSVSAFAAELPLRPDVYAALAAINAGGADDKTRYYLARELKEFRLAGVDKPAATRERIQSLRDRLTALMDEFARNIAEQPRQVTVRSAAELEGLPADFVARHEAGTDGVMTLTSDAIDQRPVLTYARNADLRRRMLLAAGTIAAPDNVAVLDEILRVRFELAGLLGYPNWAAYDAAWRMAGDVETVSRFIDRVVTVAGPKAARDVEQLTKRKQQDEPGAALNLWDRQYYAELVRRSSYAFDSQAVRPYFAFDNVLRGVLDVTGAIFDVTYRPVAGVAVWHPSVRVFEMRSGDRLVGRIYLDLHPRQNKRAGGANVATVRYGQQGRIVPEVVLAASLPGGQPGDPGLMTHDEVRTLFHEFGHVVHRLSGGHQPWQKLSSVALERDFTEAPSQMLEEWIWDPRVLATFATHYRTGQPIPEALVTQMRQASEFGQALDVRQQMVLARVALSAHDRDPRGLDVSALWKEIHGRYVPIPFLDGTARQASFPHIAQAGYASAYYTYMWSLVIAKDLFSTFEGQDLMAPALARRYVDTMFVPGSSRPAAELVTGFLGRPFNADAWERWLNRDDTPAAGK